MQVGLAVLAPRDRAAVGDAAAALRDRGAVAALLPPLTSSIDAQAD
jgi:hypothetical protein